MSNAEMVRFIVLLLVFLLLIAAIIHIVKKIHRKLRGLISKLFLCFHLTINAESNSEPHAPKPPKQLLRCAYCGTLHRIRTEESLRCRHCGAPLDPDQ